jgi:hypothetical protein
MIFPLFLLRSRPSALYRSCGIENPITELLSAFFLTPLFRGRDLRQPTGDKVFLCI